MGVCNFLAEYSLGWMTSGLGLLLVIALFVSFSGAGPAGGRFSCLRADGWVGVSPRGFWASREAAIAPTLLLRGALSAMQAVSPLVGQPFAANVLLLCAGLLGLFFFSGRSLPPPPA